MLQALPEGRFDYTYTDVSAGFFAAAEERFGESVRSIEYRVLDIEADPAQQGFDVHAYDLVIAANVLHATRDLGEALGHCRRLLAPSGVLVALEGLQGQGWLDLTFGLLEGWWRFADRYRTDHALAGEQVWREALEDTGFGEVAVLGAARESGLAEQGLLLARGPAEVPEEPGLWVLAASGVAEAVELAAGLAARNQAVVVAGADRSGNDPAEKAGAVTSYVNPERREAWAALLDGLPGEVPLRGVVHLEGLGGQGSAASTQHMAEDARRAGASALALVQGLADAGAAPAAGTWFVTRGAQVVDREPGELLAGSVLWGLGRTVGLEAAQLRPRLIDLEAGQPGLPVGLVDELLHPDRETQVAYRDGRRALRLVAGSGGAARMRLPEEPGWRLAPGEVGALEGVRVEPAPLRAPGPGEVRVAVEAAGLNFHDVLVAMGVVDAGSPLGTEACGRVVATGPEVEGIRTGDRVAGFALGAFGPEVMTQAQLVAKAPERLSAAELATVPAAFVTASLAFEMAGLGAGDTVLVHAAAGGVGQASIQLARQAGADVIATASKPKQAYLRSLGVDRVFDSRRTEFAEQVLKATGGAGVSVVLNSLTGPGFIEASLACLARNGRFVEIGKRDIWTAEEMAAARPDVDYRVVAVDALAPQEPARAGKILRSVLERIEAGDLELISHTAWTLAELGSAMDFMRSGRHTGKIVLNVPALATGRLRADRTYLVTGGLGGSARWSQAGSLTAGRRRLS